MSLTGAERQTIEYYDRNAIKWAGSHGGERESSYWERELRIFQHFLPGGNILEIGPGIGKEAKWFIDNTYDYLGIDPSIGPLKLAKVSNPSAKFLNAGTMELPGVKQKFDGFWAAASLLHISKAQIDTALQNINQVTHKNGIGFISLKEGVGETQDETGRSFSYYSQAKFAKILDRNSFTILKSDKRIDGKTTWLLYYVQKR